MLRRWLEDSGRRLENFDRTHPELNSGQSDKKVVVFVPLNEGSRNFQPPKETKLEKYNFQERAVCTSESRHDPMNFI